MLKTLLLPFGGALLLLQYLVQGTTTPQPDKHLQEILDLAHTCKNQPAAQEVFVEDLSHLVEGNTSCRNEFFCKAQKIFKRHHHVCGNNSTIYRNLLQYNKKVYPNCQKMLQRNSSMDVEVQMKALLTNLQHCVRLRIYHQRPQ